MMLTLAVALACAIALWPPRTSPLARRLRSRETSARGWRHSDPEAECLQVLDALVTVLRAGSAVSPALLMALDGVGAARPRPTRRDAPAGSDVVRNSDGAAGATAAGWQRLRDEAARDGDVAGAWRSLGKQWRSSAFEEVAAAWQLSARHGCPLADAMEGAARSVRARRAHQGCVDAATAGAKASTSVLLGLPVLGVCLGLVLGVDMLGCYRGASGFMTLWPGACLMALGAWWSRRMTASALRPAPIAVTS